MRRFWRKLSLAGVREEMHFETKRRIILLNRIAIALFLTVFSLRTIVIALGFQELSMQSLMPYVGMFVILLIPYVNKLGYYRINSFVFSLIIPVCFLFFSAISQKFNEVININHYYVPRVFIMVTIVFPLIMIDYKDRFLMYIAILVNVLCILFFDTVVDWVGVPFDPQTVKLEGFGALSRIMVLPIVLMVAGFMFLTNLNRQYESQIIGLNDDLQHKNNELEQYNEEVTSQRDLIHLKNKQLEEASTKVEKINQLLTDSITYAEKIQRAVLHEEQVPKGFFAESFIFFKPKSHVSGDFYFYKEFAVNGRSCLIVTAVDCTGHGVPGGFLSMLGITLITEVLENEIIKNAADILNHLRTRIKSTLNQTGKLSEQRDGMDMALCIYCPDTHELQFAGARNPLCIVDATGEMKILKGDRQPIGIHSKEKEFTNHQVSLSSGDMLYMFSDGLQDQFGGTAGKKFLLNNLKKLLIEISVLPAKEQKLEVDKRMKQWMNPENHKAYGQMDDIVLVGMRV